MRRIMTALVVTLAAMSQAHAADQSAAEQQIRQTDQEWVAAVAKKDPNAIAQFYSATCRCRFRRPYPSMRRQQPWLV